MQRRWLYHWERWLRKLRWIRQRFKRFAWLHWWLSVCRSRCRRWCWRRLRWFCWWWWCFEFWFVDDDQHNDGAVEDGVVKLTRLLVCFADQNDVTVVYENGNHDTEYECYVAEDDDQFCAGNDGNDDERYFIDEHPFLTTMMLNCLLMIKMMSTSIKLVFIITLMFLKMHVTTSLLKLVVIW